MQCYNFIFLVAEKTIHWLLAWPITPLCNEQFRGSSARCRSDRQMEERALCVSARTRNAFNQAFARLSRRRVKNRVERERSYLCIASCDACPDSSRTKFFNAGGCDDDDGNREKKRERERAADAFPDEKRDSMSIALSRYRAN